MWACYVGRGWAIIFIFAIQAILPAITKRFEGNTSAAIVTTEFFASAVAEDLV